MKKWVDIGVGMGGGGILLHKEGIVILIYKILRFGSDGNQKHYFPRFFW